MSLYGTYLKLIVENERFHLDEEMFENIMGLILSRDESNLQVAADIIEQSMGMEMQAFGEKYLKPYFELVRQPEPIYGSGSLRRFAKRVKNADDIIWKGKNVQPPNLSFFPLWSLQIQESHFDMLDSGLGDNRHLTSIHSIESSFRISPSLTRKPIGWIFSKSSLENHGLTDEFLSGFGADEILFDRMGFNVVPEGIYNMQNLIGLGFVSPEVDTIHVDGIANMPKLKYLSITKSGIVRDKNQFTEIKKIAQEKGIKIQ